MGSSKSEILVRWSKMVPGPVVFGQCVLGRNSFLLCVLFVFLLLTLLFRYQGFWWLYRCAGVTFFANAVGRIVMQILRNKCFKMVTTGFIFCPLFTWIELVCLFHVLFVYFFKLEFDIIMPPGCLLYMCFGFFFILPQLPKLFYWLKD